MFQVIPSWRVQFVPAGVEPPTFAADLVMREEA